MSLWCLSCFEPKPAPDCPDVCEDCKEVEAWEQAYAPKKGGVV